MKFTGIRPALDVKITADFKRIYNAFSASLSAQIYWFQIGIEAALEFLVQEGAIKIEVTDFSTEGDRKEKEKWALDFFMNKLLADWFQPTLSPGQPKVTIPPAGSGGTPPPAGSGGTPPPAGSGGTPPPPTGSGGVTPPPTGSGGVTPPPTGSGGVTPPPTGSGGVTPPPTGSGGVTPPPTGSGGVTPPPTGSGGVTPPPTGSGGVTPPPTGSGVTPPPTGIDMPPVGVGMAMKARHPHSAVATAIGVPASGTSQPARLDIETALPPGYSLTLLPSSGGTTETLVVQGGTELPLVHVGSEVRRRNISRQLTVDVQPGADIAITVEYPATQDTFETFRLLFDKTEPPEAGWVVNNPPSGLYGRYVQGTPNPPDDQQFNNSVASNSTTPRGAAALRAWVQNRLAAPKQVWVDAHASFEGDSSTTKRAFNQRLSQRRLDVALGIIGSSAETTAAAMGRLRPKRLTGAINRPIKSSILPGAQRSVLRPSRRARDFRGRCSRLAARRRQPAAHLRRRVAHLRRRVAHLRRRVAHLRQQAARLRRRAARLRQRAAHRRQQAAHPEARRSRSS